MNRILVAAFVAVACSLASTQQASAWSKFSFGTGLNIGWEGANNSYFGGCFKGGPAGPGGYDGNFGVPPMAMGHAGMNPGYAPNGMAYGPAGYSMPQSMQGPQYAPMPTSQPSYPTMPRAETQPVGYSVYPQYGDPSAYAPYYYYPTWNGW